MENFSTPRRTAVPWVTNLATLAVVATAIGWSNGQRPLDAPALSQTAPATTARAVPAGVNAANGSLQAAVPAQWPAGAMVAPADALQPVSYAPTHRR